MKTEIIYLAGGCFWCTEAVFQSLQGVISVTSGYMGGTLQNPTYHQVAMGTTGHAETVRIEYDSKIISLDNILEVFFDTHDPTSLNQQGNDVGPEYRSEIFYVDDTQKEIAEKSRAEYQNKLGEERKIVTNIEKALKFFPAEEYHKNYFKEHKTSSYCQIVISPKLEKLKKIHRDKFRT